MKESNIISTPDPESLSSPPTVSQSVSSILGDKKLANVPNGQNLNPSVPVINKNFLNES